VPALLTIAVLALLDGLEINGLLSLLCQSQVVCVCVLGLQCLGV
jgi:hypothetical protein